MYREFFQDKDDIIVKGVLILCFCFLAFVLWYFRNPFVSEYTFEAGGQLPIEQLLTNKDCKDKIKYLTHVDEEILNYIGEYLIKVDARGIEFRVSLKVVDTTPPQATVQERTFWIGDKIEAKDFVKDIKDAADVKVSFEKDLDLKKEGQQNVFLVLQDQSQNITKYETVLILKKDTKAPNISGPNTILSSKGDTISYKKDFKVTDNRDKEVELKVDSSKVNFNKAGKYIATYSAIDQAGNKATKKVQVIILDKSDEHNKKEAIKLADQLIAKLCKNKKTKQDKLKVCYDYIRNNIVYDGNHEGSQENYYVDALTGFKTFKGDCLVSNGMLRVICERLDIPTIVVERTSHLRTNHYWFLADAGDGWYHYDAFKRADGIIYKWTDSQIISWSKSHGNKADFDQSKYPKTPKK